MRTGYGLWNAEHGSAVMGSDREDHPEQRRGVDLRRSPRHRLVLPVDLAFENETSNALVLDLSENGCLIEAERRIELGETLQIEFYENPELRYKAKIIWGGDALYGCQFFQPIPETIVEEARLWTVPRLIGEAIDGQQRGPVRCRTRPARWRQQTHSLVVGNGKKPPDEREPGQSQAGLANGNGRRCRARRRRRTGREGSAIAQPGRRAPSPVDGRRTRRRARQYQDQHRVRLNATQRRAVRARHRRRSRRSTVLRELQDLLA